VKRATRATRSRHVPRMGAAIALAMLASCVGSPGLLAPSGPRELEGTVFDAVGDLPGGRPTPLAGARLELLDGPKAGAFVMSDSAGKYKLPPLIEGPVTVRATKAGFDSHTQSVYPEYYMGPPFKMGHPPHTLWGDISQAGTTPAVPVPGVRLEILDGANAGKVVVGDETGRFRFDDLVASNSYTVRLSKPGFQMRTYGRFELRHTEQNNFQIAVE
jgi:carboxypeptidase family protein